MSRKAETESGKTVPSLIMIESAARGIWQTVKPEDKSTSILFLAGSGNNGSDALAAARIAYLDGFHNIDILALEPRGEEAKIQHRILSRFPVRIHTEYPDRPFAIIVDGLFGLGLSRPLGGRALKWVERANRSRALKVAIDIPSGVAEEVVSNSPCFKADITVSTGGDKQVLYAPYVPSGKVVTVNPSFPPSVLEECGHSCGAWKVEEGDLKFSGLSLTDYKGSRGRVGIWGGSGKYTGAALLSAHAAFHAGSGFVTLFADNLYYPVAVQHPSVIVRHDTEPFEGDAVLAGPGWGEGKEEMLSHILALGKPLVIDADGIRAFCALYDKNRRLENVVLTPHIGELGQLFRTVLGKEFSTPGEFYPLLLRLSSLLGCVVVAKAHHNYISDGKRVYVIEGNNPSLGVAGSGDILAGIIVSFLGRGESCLSAALKGAWVHQRAGKLASDRYGFYDPRTLIEMVGKVEG